MLGTSSCALLVGGSLWIQKSLCLKQQILVHLRPPRWKTLEIDRGRGAGRTHWVYATAACSPAGRQRDAGVAAVRGTSRLGPRGGRSSEISAAPRCSREVSGLGGNALPGSQ